jgi:hypothetical protein
VPVDIGLQEKLRASIVQSDDGGGVAADLGVQDATGKAEIAESKNVVPGDEKVGWFEVAMDDVVRMADRQGSQQLFDVGQTVVPGEKRGTRVVEKAVEVEFAIVEGEMNVRFGHIQADDSSKPDDVVVVERLQKLDLADRAQRKAVFRMEEIYPLERQDEARLLVPAFEYFAVGAGTDFGNNVEAFIK